MVILKEELSLDRYYVKCNGYFTEIKNGIIYNSSSGKGSRISFFYQHNGEAVHINYNEVVAEMQKKIKFIDSQIPNEVINPYSGSSYKTVGDRLVSEVQELKSVLVENVESLMDMGRQLHGRYVHAQSNRPRITDNSNLQPLPALVLATTSNDDQLDLQQLEEKQRRAMADSRSKVKYKSLYGREISIDHERMELISKFARKHTDFIEFNGRSRVSPSRFDTDLQYCNQFLYKLTPMVVIELQDLIGLMDKINGQDGQKNDKILFASKLGLVDVNLNKRRLFTNMSFKRQRESSSNNIFEGGHNKSTSDSSTSSDKISDSHDHDHVLISRQENDSKILQHTALIHEDKITNSPKRKTRSSVVPCVKKPSYPDKSPMNSDDISKELSGCLLRNKKNVAVRQSSSESHQSCEEIASTSDSDVVGKKKRSLTRLNELSTSDNDNAEYSIKATKKSTYSSILLKSSSDSDFENSIKIDTRLSKKRKFSHAQPERVKSLLQNRPQNPYSPVKVIHSTPIIMEPESQPSTSFDALKTNTLDNISAKGKDKVKSNMKKFGIDQEFAQHSFDSSSSSKIISGSQKYSRTSTAEIRNYSDKKSCQFYNVTEDRILLKWVMKGNNAKRVNGNAIWKELEAKEFTVEGKPVRSWQSLRNRFLKYILLNLHDYGLQYEDEKKIRLKACTGSIKKKEIRMDKTKVPGFSESLQKRSSTSRGFVTKTKTNLQDHFAQAEQLNDSLAFSEIEVCNFTYSANKNYQNLNKSQPSPLNEYAKPKRKLFTDVGFLNASIIEQEDTL